MLKTMPRLWGRLAALPSFLLRTTTNAGFWSVYRVIEAKMNKGKLAMLLAAVLVISVAVLVGVNWAPDRSVESLKRRWAPAPSTFVIIDGMSVHLRDEGPLDDPHPIVLIHGTSSSLHTWEGWVAILKATHRVVSLDLPGFGLTGPFPDDDYRIEHYTRFLGDSLDLLGVNRAVLVGNSFGGRVAWQTALARPDLADRLVLIDSRGYPVDEKSLPVVWRIAQIPILGSLITRITPRGIIKKGVVRVYGDPGKVTSDLIDRYYELTLRVGNRRALTLLLQQGQITDSDRIKTIKIPTLILWGRLDPQVPLSDAERFHKDIAGSELIVLDGLGHVPHEEDPAGSLKAVEPFLVFRGGDVAVR
jgi:pimeloyl-ACP methyl ester carboxylesterase